MPIRNIDRLVGHLEENATDELAQLASLGAEYYSTEQLLRLRGQWEIKNQLFHLFQRVFIRIVAFSPIWLVLWWGCGLLKLKGLSLFFLSLFPLSFMIFFVGLWFMLTFFKGKGHLDRVGEMIAQELTKRKQQKNSPNL